MSGAVEKSAGSDFFVHRLGVCESNKVGSGTRIWAFAHVMKGARVGRDCNIGEHVFIESGAVVGDTCTIKNGVAVWDGVTLESGVFVGPYAVFTNDLLPRAFLRRKDPVFLKTHIGVGASIGANATIVCGNKIGAYAMIGAGAVVTKDVPAHALVVGNPGRIVGRVCFCGEVLQKDGNCSECKISLEANSIQRVMARLKTDLR